MTKWLNNDFVIENCLNTQKINNYSVICSSHFNPDFFIMHKNNRSLDKNAVPSLIVSRVKSVSYFDLIIFICAFYYLYN